MPTRAPSIDSVIELPDPADLRRQDEAPAPTSKADVVADSAWEQRKEALSISGIPAAVSDRLGLWIEELKSIDITCDRVIAAEWLRSSLGQIPVWITDALGPRPNVGAFDWRIHAWATETQDKINNWSSNKKRKAGWLWSEESDVWVPPTCFKLLAPRASRRSSCCFN